MMKRISKLCLMLTFVLASMMANAQSKGDFGYGVKIGANLSNFADNDYGNRCGFTAGLLCDYGVTDKIAVSLEALYSEQGADVLETNTVAGGVYSEYSHELSYIQVPVMLQYKVWKNIGVKAGFQVGFLVHQKNIYTVDDVVLRKDFTTSPYNEVDMSVPMALTYTIKDRFIFEYRYNFGLSVLNDESAEYYMYNEKKFKNRFMVLSVGVRF